MRTYLGRWPALFLLGAILVNLLTMPLLSLRSDRFGWLVVLLFMLLVVTAFRATAASRRMRRVLGALGGVALLAAWVRYGLAEQAPRWGYSELVDCIRHAAAIGFAGITVWLLVARALARGRVTADRVQVAICAYLLMGWMWAEGYGLLTALHGPVLSSQPGADFNDLVYFSYVTLTTLGYGDVAPVHPAAKVVAYLEAVTGVIFLATLVARLVALQIVHESSEPYDDDNEVS
ncbi:MAG: potassium channel family protein [Planctomycetota bacterium]|nr:potassium channel family protein [Planctomycetota bacterium]